MLSREGLFTRVPMNVLFMLMFYDGGERSTVTKNGTRMLSKHEQPTGRGKKALNTLRPWFSIIRNIEQNFVEEKKLQLA